MPIGAATSSRWPKHRRLPSTSLTLQRKLVVGTRRDISKLSRYFPPRPRRLLPWPRHSLSSGFVPFDPGSSPTGRRARRRAHGQLRFQRTGARSCSSAAGRRRPSLISRRGELLWRPWSRDRPHRDRRRRPRRAASRLSVSTLVPGGAHARHRGAT
jgi:hypothetical protein